MIGGGGGVVFSLLDDFMTTGVFNAVYFEYFGYPFEKWGEKDGKGQDRYRDGTRNQDQD